MSCKHYGNSNSQKTRSTARSEQAQTASGKARESERGNEIKSMKEQEAAGCREEAAVLGHKQPRALYPPALAAATASAELQNRVRNASSGACAVLQELLCWKEHGRGR